MCSVSLQPALAFGGGGFARRMHDVGRHAGERGLVLDEQRPGVGRVEHVVVELRRQLRELLLHGLEARLAVGRQLRAAEAEVAQLVLDAAGAAPASTRRERRRLRRSAR